jgi:mRNA interferase MazF
MTAPALWSPDRRDVIWIDCDPQAGHEMRGMHPFLVLSPRTFNERTGLVIGLPMTTASYNDSNPFAVKILGGNGVTSYILSHQPKSFDWQRRRASPHPMKKVSLDAFSLACMHLNGIIALG